MLARMLLPSFAVAVILTFPRFTPVTFPFPSTVAIFSSWEAQVTSCIAASSGRTDAVRLIVCPTATSFSDDATAIRVTGW